MLNLKGKFFQINSGAALARVLLGDSVLSTVLIMYAGHCKEFLKLMFGVLALCQSKANCLF